MPRLATRNPAPTVVQDDVDLPPKFPDLPDDILKRFPSLNDWEEDTTNWWNRAQNAIQNNNRVVSQSVTKGNSDVIDLRVSINGNTAAITEERIARITADEVLARRIVTVSAIAGVASNITIQGTPPGTPVANDYWVDNSDPLNPITYQWSGTEWDEVTDPISVAAVAEEQSARITADGNLEGYYSLTAVAGNVVTGMILRSASGPNPPISSVIFRATDFQIYNGASGVTMFEVSGSDVNLAGTLTVSTSGKVFIGTGTYGNTNTAWYVDSAGKFSLKDKLTWDGSVLGVNGTIVGTAGYFGSSVNAVAITTDGLSVGNTGAIEGGQTAYNTGTGFWLGYNSGHYKFSIGDSTANYLTWDGSTLDLSCIGISLWDIAASETTLIIETTGTSTTRYGAISLQQWHSGSLTAELDITPGGIQFSPNNEIIGWYGVSGEVGLNAKLFLTSGANAANVYCSGTSILATDAKFGIGAGTANTQLQITSLANTIDYDAIFDRVRGGGSNNTGILFRNDFWTNNTTAGMAGIVAVDTTSSGGELHLKVTANGGGAGGAPVDALIILNDGTLQFGVRTATPLAIDGYIPIKTLAGASVKLATVS